MKSSEHRRDEVPRRGLTGHIVTVTPNPSVDRTVVVDGLTVGAVNRAESVRVDPGGKGVNVSRALTAHGRSTTAVLPVGGNEGQLLSQLLTAAGVHVAGVAIGAPTRSNLSIVAPGGSTTKINEPGPRLTDQEQDDLLATITAQLDVAAAWVVGSGSLPPGLAPEFYAQLVHAAALRGVRCAVDTTGAALLAAARAGAELLKPNESELSEALRLPLNTLGDVIAAAEQLRPAAGQVLVSLGAGGAVLVDSTGAVHAQARCSAPISTVGAGDSLLAGYLFAGTCDAAALATAVAWGTAAVGLPGSQMPGPSDVWGIDVTLSEPQTELSLTT